ncbi:MAG: DNA mismatch repair endonuclease MutL [Selenomonadaceae bacterium]|nr:DNA mismatch repair endonuclease MutL [Selenomonadaceae bacterium]
MGKINLLDSNTINKIAAGEVVERPASCVKELIENSIDAGATRVEIEIQVGGKSFIRVTDNGIGMNREDASLSIRRHATSKIKTSADLTNIETLGFRGEALPTITSVSKFKMHTRREGSELGTSVNIEGGKNQNIQEVGCPLGTTIQIEELFFNTPVRKKFLKTTNTEAAKIHDYIVKLALSRPSIAFKFINGNRVALRTPGNGDLFDTIASIYGREVADSLLKIDFTDSDEDNFYIKGYISKPNVLKSYRSWQTFIVNGRVINNRIISKAVDEAYKSLIPKVGFPLAILIINVPPLSIDVNVHPQKTEIRFEDEGKIYRAVYNSITQSMELKDFADSNKNDELQNIAAIPDNVEHYGNIVSEKLAKQQNHLRFNDIKDDFSHSIDFQSNSNIDKVNNDLENINKESFNNVNKSIENADSNSHIDDNLALNSNTTQDTHVEPIKKITPIGQVGLCYIIAQADDGLYIVDQHAAHERILFDKLSSHTDGIPAQQLLVHQILHFDERESQLIEDHLELFAKLGFTMEPSGNNEYRLMEIPVDIDNIDAEDMLREILTNLPPIEDNDNIDEVHQKSIAKYIRQACLAMTACKAAIKSGQSLSLQQMQVLLDQLSQTPYPFTCPHGRPTILKFTNQELAKMFKRT